MTPYEFYTNFKDFLKSLTWGSTSNKIFGDAVFIVPEIPQKQLYSLPNPTCFIVDEGRIVHEQNPQLLICSFSLGVFIRNDLDRLSEATLIGGCREDNTSNGVGMLELEEELYNKITSKYELDSQRIYIIERRHSVISEGIMMKQSILRFYKCSIMLEI